MFNVSRKPGPPLGDFVDSLWMFGDAAPHARERILPSGTIELVINLHEDEIRIYDPVHLDRYQRFSGAVVSGAYRSFFVIDTLEHTSIMGVHFKPGGAFPFLGSRASELADMHVDLETLWGAHAKTLRERLCMASNVALRFQILEQALLSHLFRPLERRSAVRHALHCLGQSTASIREIAGVLGLSDRRFIEVFAAEVGMTPKLFRRVHRFQRALELARQNPAPNWGDLAQDCGYFDQSHMIRDFQAFSGFTPAEYLRHLNAYVKDNHVALP
ncbi:MAG TPA: helix-turn-helix domain-containing protein [Chthonomonadaceae bacterium]|nr:helix-turn-helix domain-containing protein [Chthonomonadaceae bacterium]